MDQWPYANDVTLDFSRPGKPTDSAWRKYYNEDRPHRAIGNKAPITLVNRWRNQPVTVTMAGKLQSRAVQRMVSDQ